jgi:hypothetical protein
MKDATTSDLLKARRRSAMKTGTLLLVAGLVLSGCQQNPEPLLALKIELTALKEELRLLRDQAEDLDPRVSMVETMARQVFEERDGIARLDCARRNTEVLPTQFIALTVNCEAAGASAGGYKLRLRVGNPTSARLDGLKLTVYAGEGAGKGLSILRFFHAVPTSLAPGSLTSVEVSLPAGSERMLDDLAVRAQIDHLTMAQR